LVEIIPAILTDSSARFKELVRRLEPYVNRIHVDVADAELVPSRTVTGYKEIKDTAVAVKFDVHLMVKRPQEYLKEWFYTHADRFIIHVESDANLGEIIKNIKEHGRRVGVAFNPETEPEKSERYFKDIDFVQFMTVHPGFQGGKFVNDVVDNISKFHKKYPGIIIMCDGGVNPEIAPGLIRAGASALVSGSYVVKSGDMEKAIQQLQEATEK